MAIAPYNYGSGAAPTPAPTKAAGKIAPYKYAAPTTPAPSGLSPDEQALVNKIPPPVPVKAPAQTTFSMKPSSPAPFSTIKPAAPAPRLEGTLLPGVDLTNLNGKNALDSGFGENEPLPIKAPFIDKGTYTANDLPNQAIGGLVEWPERLVRSIGQYAQMIATGGKFTAQDPSKSNFTAQTTPEATAAFNDLLTNQAGFTPNQAAWISGLYGVSSGALDLLGLEGVLQKSVAKVAAQSALAPEDVAAARTLLGDPKTLGEAETSYRNLQKLSHPDMPGANTKLSTQASDAIRVLRQADKEGVLGTVARAAQQAQKPLSEVFGGAKPAVKPAALLPETTGKVKPFDYSKTEPTTVPPEKPASTPEPITPIEEKPVASPEKPIVAKASAISDEAATGVGEATVAVTREQVANDYYQKQVAPKIQSGETIVIDPDKVREEFGDYSEGNRQTFSQATQDILDRALRESTAKDFTLVGGGPGGGKSEFFTKGLVAAEHPGVIYDATQSDAAFVSKLVAKARSLGKDVTAYFVISDPEEARFWTLVREAETGRPVHHDFFVKAHSKYPDTILRLAEEGVQIRAVDARGKHGFQVRAAISNGNFANNIVDIIKKMDYSENTIRAKAQASEKYYATHSEQPKTPQRESTKGASTERGGTLREGGSDKGGVRSETTGEGKPEPRKLTLKPEILKGKEKATVTGPGNTKEVPLHIHGKRVARPDQLVTKTDLRNMIDTLPGKSADFKVIEKDGKKYMSFEYRGTRMLLRPSALGLVEDNIKVGDTISVSKEDLKATGTGIRAHSEEGVEASLANDFASGEVNPAKSIEEIKQRIDQLNKFGQSKAILRRTGGLPKKAAGMFRHVKAGAPNPKGIPEKGQVHLQDNVVANDKQYVETLAHELGHALEFTLTGTTNKDTFRVFGKDLSDEIKDTIRAELKANTNKMVGEEVAKKGAGYYYKNTELLARFLENMFVRPGEVAELAPTALKYFEQSAIETPVVGEYLDAVRGEIDKGQLKHVFMRDMKETYVKLLGKRVGEMAWNDELRYRSMKERAKIQVEKLVKGKFKGVKDNPETLFRSAESILVTKDDKPVFGTRDFQTAKTDADAAKLMMNGWEPLLDGEGRVVSEIVDGKVAARFAKPRYSAAQGKRLFDSLSPEGQKLVKDFTAARAEAKDYFNREVIKDVHNINSNLEGWVHRYWDEKATGIGGDKLKTKIAAAKKLRTGAEGYVEDLQKAMTKALTELETAKAYNAFIEDYFARVSRPIAEGEEPMPGYVEVQGNVRKGGVGRPSEIKKIIIEDGKATLAKNVRYQMPAEIYKRFQMIRELAVEASTAAKVMNSINRYWRVNILFYPGSAATNMISGALQYGTKVINDFYVEALTGDVTFPRSRQNVFSMITATTPKGWQSAPDWIYGNDLSNWYGEFASKKTPGIFGEKADEGIDKYADKALKLYGAVERYWKKVISISEGASHLGSLNQMTTEGLRLPTEDEKALLDQMNKEIDLYAYDYDNVPNWLEAHQQSAFGQAIKPFAKYPYKYTKQLTEMAQAAFDGTLPWQERVAKVLTLATVASLYAAAANKRKSLEKTPEVSSSAPPSVSTRGRLFMGTDSDGKEIFTRVAKYPFLNVTEAGLQLSQGHFDTANQLMQDMVGSISPIGDVGIAAMGYSNQYQTYQPLASRIGQDVASFIPASRMLADIARFFDPYQRKQTTFLQGITSLYPTTDPALQEKLHGDIKTIQVPLENGVQAQPGEKATRTTTDMDVLNYKTDLLLGFLAGLYETRIDPNVAAAFNTRDAENKAAAEARTKRLELQKLSKP